MLLADVITTFCTCSTFFFAIVVSPCCAADASLAGITLDTKEDITSSTVQEAKKVNFFMGFGFYLKDTICQKAITAY